MLEKAQLKDYIEGTYRRGWARVNCPVDPQKERGVFGAFPCNVIGDLG